MPFAVRPRLLYAWGKPRWRESHDPQRRPPVGGEPRSARCRSGLLRARRELYRADQRADRTQFDQRRRLPPRGRRRVYGGGGRTVARPRRGGDLVARTGPVERDGIAALGLSRRDANGDA